jgi:hypothetical protein
MKNEARGCSADHRRIAGVLRRVAQYFGAEHVVSSHEERRNVDSLVIPSRGIAFARSKTDAFAIDKKAITRVC